MVQRQRGQETRIRIAKSAEELFSRQGYVATGVSEICRAAGVSKGAFYHHFVSKQALFLALLNRWLDGLDAEFVRIRSGTQTVPESITHMAEMLGPIFQECRDQVPIIFEFWMQARYDSTVWAAAIEPYRRYQTYFADLIRMGIQEGSFSDVDADLAAQTLVSLVIGLLLQGLLDPDGADWTNVALHSVEMWLIGLRRD